MAAPEVLDEELRALDSWDFDVFKVASLAPDQVLSVVAPAVFRELGLMDKFSIDATRFSNFVRRIEAGYNAANTYHNSIHAADVTQATYFMLQTGNIRAALSPEQVFALAFSAMVHDVGHGGVSNAFEVATLSPLAVLYNDSSPLENHHISEAFRLALSDDSLNIFAGLEPAVFKEVRRLSIRFVLATDIGTHMDLVTRYSATASSAVLPAEGQTAVEDAELLCQLVIQSADTSNAARPRQSALRWAGRVMNEFFQQGDREKALSLPVSRGMDSESTTVPAAQLGFIRFLVVPRIKALSDRFKGLLPCLENVEANIAFWDQASAEEYSLDWIERTCKGQDVEQT